jgi:type VI secretion system Hcp family effector
MIMKPAIYLSALFSGLFLLTARPASAQDTKMFMKATFFKQGAVTGSAANVDGVGKGLIQLTNVSFNETAPTTADTYKDKGATKHEILKVSKKIDASSPQFLMAFSNGEKLNEVLIEFTKQSKYGKETAFMTIRLSGSVVISAFKQNGDSETISFSYTEMTVTEPNP